MRLTAAAAAAVLASATLARARLRIPCLPQVEYDTDAGAGAPSATAYTADQLTYDELSSAPSGSAYSAPLYVDPAAVIVSLSRVQAGGNATEGGDGIFDAVRQAAGAADTQCVDGGTSRICVEFPALQAGASGGGEVEVEKFGKAKVIVMEAARIWADVFPSAVEIRVLATWAGLGAGVLGSAGPTFYFWGGGCDLSLKPQLYSPAILNSVLGRDYDDGEGVLDHHIKLSMSSSVDWHFGLAGDRPPAGNLDFLSLVLHEMAHGLFFISFSNARGSEASFRPGFGVNEWREDGTQIAISQRTPSHFDRFLTDGASTPLVALCEDPSAFFNTLVTAVRFVDPRAAAAGRPTDFAMHSPATYSYGTSTTHFLEDDGERAADCEKNGLDGADPNQCSGLMSPSLTRGQAQHEIGQNTLRVLESHLDAAAGFTGTCKINPWISFF